MIINHDDDEKRTVDITPCRRPSMHATCDWPTPRLFWYGTMTTESSINTCNQSDTKSNTNHNHNPNFNPTTKQYAVVSIQLNSVTCPMYPEKFIRNNVVAPFLQLSVVIVTLPALSAHEPQIQNRTTGRLAVFSGCCSCCSWGGGNQSFVLSAAANVAVLMPLIAISWCIFLALGESLASPTSIFLNVTKIFTRHKIHT